jgi:hypothetical protein
MIKLLNVDTSGKVPCPVAENLDLAKLRGLKTLGGVGLAGKFPALTIKLTDGEESPPGIVDYFKVGLLNVVSSNLKTVLEGAGAEIEYFPATILYHEEPTSTNYFVANPLKRFPAIDIDSSDVVIDDELGDVLEVNRLVIDQSKFDDTKLAVVAEIQQIALQIEVARAIESSGCTGCKFIDPNSVRF